ncbi:MAG: hypothetical protein VBE63_09985 [Lamprobacter sp.]|uniref:hypothetical protein n=1 Tax=Lamprobacter sp. TaxID=3100796 RepID=UPI002B26017C|nr:hypothetical protein [Lamprobacter sp.]MEA3640260.1 hypothetical protein [Lamprobacter sp.]
MKSNRNQLITYRVMVMQETGEELCVDDNIVGLDRAQDIMQDVLEQHEEWRAWIEREQNWRSYY